MFSPKVIALTLSLFGAASASPLISRGNCSPNFQGADLLVTNQANSWFTTPDRAYRVEYSGQWPDSYLIKLADNHDTVVAATAETAGSGLTEVPINWSSSDPLQIWDVRCDSCNGPTPGIKFTTGCRISLHAASNLCVALDGSTLELAHCNGQAEQKWDFAMA